MSRAWLATVVSLLLIFSTSIPASANPCKELYENYENLDFPGLVAEVKASYNPVLLTGWVLDMMTLYHMERLVDGRNREQTPAQDFSRMTEELPAEVRRYLKPLERGLREIRALQEAAKSGEDAYEIIERWIALRDKFKPQWLTKPLEILETTRERVEGKWLDAAQSGGVQTEGREVGGDRKGILEGFDEMFQQERGVRLSALNLRLEEAIARQNRRDVESLLSLRYGRGLELVYEDMFTRWEELDAAERAPWMSTKGQQYIGLFEQYGVISVSGSSIVPF